MSETETMNRKAIEDRQSVLQKQIEKLDAKRERLENDLGDVNGQLNDLWDEFEQLAVDLRTLVQEEQEALNEED